jgi:hypothetical protein
MTIPDHLRSVLAGLAVAGLTLAATLGPTAARAAGGAETPEGARVQITGELIDTWCYLSGVMGGPDAVVGSAHHTCAMWCAAGGIPVGVLADDGRVYMVVKWQGSTDATAGADDTLMRLASHRVTADGVHYSRDGIDYLMVSDVVSDAGITNHNHDDYGVVPGFAFPEPAR